MIREPGLAHPRIDDQRVRGEQRAEQEHRRHGPPEDRAHGHPEGSGDGEREQPQSRSRPPVVAEHLQIELEPRGEHQVEEPELPELWHRLIPGRDEPDAVRADQEPAHDQTDQPGKPEAADNDRPEQDHREQDEELEDRPVRSLLGRQQRDAQSSVRIRGTSCSSSPSHFLDQAVDRAVGLKAVDRGVDDLPVGRPVRQSGGEVAFAGKLAQHVQARRVVAAKAERDREVE